MVQFDINQPLSRRTTTLGWNVPVYWLLHVVRLVYPSIDIKPRLLRQWRIGSIRR